MLLNLNPKATPFFPTDCNYNSDNSNYNQELSFNFNDYSLSIISLIEDESYWHEIDQILINKRENKLKYENVLKELKLKIRKKNIDMLKKKNQKNTR